MNLVMKNKNFGWKVRKSIPLVVKTVSEKEFWCSPITESNSHRNFCIMPYCNVIGFMHGVTHLVRTHEGGEGGQANAYECVQGGEGGLTHEVRTQSKNLPAFYIHPAIFSFAKVP